VQAPSADAQAHLDTKAKGTPASAAPAGAGGGYNNQIGNGKANYGVNTHFDPNTMKNVFKQLDPKAVNVVPNTTNPTTSSQDQTAKLRSNLAASQKARAASKFNSNQEYAKEGIQYYSRFLKTMI
jgi:inosine-uridine nucleoside N-ribohydrolase